jgi:hypothetical protein
LDVLAAETELSPAGARQVRNDSESAARIAMFSSTAPVGAVVYPDSDMIRIFSTDATDDWSCLPGLRRG